MPEDLDDLGKEFGATRRRCREISRRMVHMLDADQREAARAFRQTTMAHLARIAECMETPVRYFSAEAIKSAVDLARQTGDGIPAGKAVEFATAFLALIFEHVPGTLQARMPFAADWRNLGLSIDDESGSIYARMYDHRDGRVLARTVPVAYFDDHHMIPAENSDWFWSSDISVSALLPGSMPFEKAEADPANDTDLIRDECTAAVKRAVENLTAALERAQRPEFTNDDMEKLKIEIDLQFNRCLPINQLMSGNHEMYKQLIARDPCNVAQTLIEWSGQYLKEVEAVASMRRSVLKFSGYTVRVPDTVPGLVGKFLTNTFDDQQIRHALYSYGSYVLGSGKKSTGEDHEATTDILNVYPDARAAVEGIEGSAARLTAVVEWLAGGPTEMVDEDRADEPTAD